MAYQPLHPIAQDLTERVCKIHKALACSCSLKPSASINQLFTDLVEATNRQPEPIVAQVLAHPDIQRLQPHLHHICAMGEYEMEVFWSDRIAKSQDPRRELAKFPYTKNYQDLARLEHHALQMNGGIPNRVLFVGAGPLPLSAYYFATEHGLQVDLMDIDTCACQQATAFFSALGANHGLQAIHRNVLAHTDFSAYDVVMLAALVGLKPAEKRQVITHLAEHMKSGALLLVRSAHELRTLLYPAVSPDDLYGFALIACVHPLNDVVNSVIVAQKK